MAWTPPSNTLQHGERFGQLTVLARAGDPNKRAPKYRCGCTCGNSRFYAKRCALLRGEVTRCDRCDSRSATGGES